MKKKTYTVLTLILSLLCMNKTYAACTREEIKEFKRIEDEYKVTYNYNKDTKDYSIYFKSTEPKKYYYQIYAESDLNCSAINETTMECKDFKPDYYTIEIVGVTNTCNDVLKSITLNLSHNNKYWEDPLCNGIEEFVLCSPTYDKELDYETFVSRVETYKRTKAKEAETEKNNNEEKNNGLYDKIINYINENIISIIIVTVFIILVIITIIVTAKSIRKSRRLE